MKKNMMTVVPRLSQHEVDWCAYLWQQDTEERSTSTVNTPSHKIMLLPRDRLLRLARRRRLTGGILEHEWVDSLDSLIEKLKDEHDDAHTEADR